MVQLDPTKWLVAVAGFASDWFFSRKWSRIFQYSIPMFLLVLLAGAVFWGSNLDRTALRNRYIELGEAELERWEAELAKPMEVTPTAAADGSPENTDAAESDEHPASDAPEDEAKAAEAAAAEKKQLSPYAEMLFRRAHLLEPSSQTQFVIGARLWQRGVMSNARQTLEKVAPKDSKGYPPAHAVLAKICQQEFAETKNPALIEEFQHHAKYAVEWPNAFPDVLFEEAALLWQRRKTAECIDYLKTAAKHHPDFYVALVERAKQAGQDVIAEAARQEAVEHFRAKISADPKNEKSRIQLAQLLVLGAEGETEAEAILIEGQKQKPSRIMARALSEIYRIRFVRQLEASKNAQAELTLLEKALQIDPTNPEIAQTVAALMKSGIQTNEQLGEELNRVLVSGHATMATHAILSEYHLANGRHAAAKTHLEQVYKAAPMSVKYSNNLAYLYAKEGKYAEAEKTAVQTLALIKQNSTFNEPYVDELLDTLGMIYQSQKKTSDAISAYEACIRVNPRRTNTRARLVDLYKQTGNEGVAKAHEEAIKAIEKAIAEQAEQQAQPAPTTTTDSNATALPPEQSTPESKPLPAEPKAESAAEPSNTTSSDASAPASPTETP